MKVGFSDILCILAISSILLITVFADLLSDAFIYKYLYPQCLAITRAKVVFPQPGGPDNKINLCSSSSYLLFPFEFYYFSV